MNSRAPVVRPQTPAKQPKNDAGLVRVALRQDERFHFSLRLASADVIGASGMIWCRPLSR